MSTQWFLAAVPSSTLFWDVFTKTLLEHPSFSEVFAPLLVGCILAWLGLGVYFRRKEYELVQKRYLDDGLDLLVDDFGATLANYRSNWFDGILLIQAFRNGVVSECEVERGARQQPGSYGMATVQRLERMVGDEKHSLSWMTQSLYAFVDRANSFVHYDLAPGIREARRLSDEGPSAANGDEIQKAISEYEERMKQLPGDCKPYEVFVTQMGELAGILEQQEFSLKMIRRFRQHKRVRAWVSRLHEQRAEIQDVG